VAAAEQMTRPEALHQFLTTYFPAAVYAVPAVLAKHLGLPEMELRAGLDRLARERQAVTLSIPPHKGSCYQWVG
jgi:hypothetical protein